MVKIGNSVKDQVAFILSHDDEANAITETKPYRLYSFIDYDNGITKVEIEKFECLFEKYKLDDELFNGGLKFDIDQFDCKDLLKRFYIPIPSALRPRDGMDGGVIR